jgi:glyoxylase-like metal-dependent hydrolase (beta-lactamase superfamily II)
MPIPPIEILPDFFFIQRGYLNANHFALRAYRPILIDTGYLGDWEVTKAILTELGLDLDRTALIINTHTHCDHIGGNQRIQARSGCGIALHPRGYRFMQAEDDHSPWWSYFHQEAAFFEPTECLPDGQEIQLGPYVFEVIHTPGHASDGLVLYCRSRRILLSSDTLWENDFPVMTLAVEGAGAIETMLVSLNKIANLEVERVFPGHGAPFEDFNPALVRAMNRLKRFQTDLQRVGWDLVKKIFVYTVLMRKRVPRATFFEDLMVTRWYPDTVDRYFSGDYRTVYDTVVSEFDRRQIIYRQGKDWVTTVSP